MAYITTSDNIQLYLKDWGSGRPVVLVHGWPLSADSWDGAPHGLFATHKEQLSKDLLAFLRQ